MTAPLVHNRAHTFTFTLTLTCANTHKYSHTHALATAQIHKLTLRARRASVFLRGPGGRGQVTENARILRRTRARKTNEGETESYAPPTRPRGDGEEMFFIFFILSTTLSLLLHLSDISRSYFFFSSRIYFYFFIFPSRSF